MTALAADRNTPRRQGAQYRDPVGAAVICYIGGLAVLNAGGWAVPGTTATGLVPRGVFTKHVDNATGANGDVDVDIEPGIYKFEPDGSDTPTRADIGSPGYIVDDQTIANDSASSTRSEAGTITDIDTDGGVWVAVGIDFKAE